MNCFEQKNRPKTVREQKWRLHQLGYSHFTYYKTKRQVLKAARTAAEGGGDWLIFKADHSGGLTRVACIGKYHEGK